MKFLYTVPLFIGLLLLAGCEGSNVTINVQGPTGPTGPKGSAGPAESTESTESTESIGPS